jgi:hypothetical protein
MKAFSQEYIDLYDENKDGVWDFNEFSTMATGGQEIPPALKADYEALHKTLFDDLNLDKNTNEINAGELASMFMMGDLDMNAYAEYGISSDSLDGKIDYGQYQAVSSAVAMDSGENVAKWSKQERQDFYEYFYAE